MSKKPVAARKATAPKLKIGLPVDVKRRDGSVTSGKVASAVASVVDSIGRTSLWVNVNISTDPKKKELICVRPGQCTPKIASVGG